MAGRQQVRQRVALVLPGDHHDATQLGRGLAPGGGSPPDLLVELPGHGTLAVPLDDLDHAHEEGGEELVCIAHATRGHPGIVPVLLEHSLEARDLITSDVEVRRGREDLAHLRHDLLERGPDLGCRHVHVAGPLGVEQVTARTQHRAGVAGPVDLGHQRHPARVGVLHERLQFIQLVARHSATVPRAECGVRRRGEGPALVVREVKLDEVQLVRPCERDELLELGDGVRAARDIDHERAMGGARDVPHSPHRPARLAGLGIEQLQEGGAGVRQPTRVARAEHHGVGDLELVFEAPAQVRVQLQGDVAGPGRALVHARRVPGERAQLGRQGARERQALLAIHHDAGSRAPGEVPGVERDGVRPGHQRGVRGLVLRASHGRPGYDHAREGGRQQRSGEPVGARMGVQGLAGVEEARGPSRSP